MKISEEEKLLHLYEISAHDVKNKLAGILGISELLLLEEGIPNKIRNDLEVIRNSSHSISNTLKNMVYFSRICRDGGELPAGPSNLYEVTRKQIYLLMKCSKNKKLSIVNNTKNSSLDVGMDEKFLGSIVYNLLQNSVKYGGNEIELSAESGGITKDGRPFFVYSNRDKGPGISADLLGKIFVPFEGNGTGIGLCAVKEIVEAYKGGIEIDTSTTEPTYTRISLTLPSYSRIIRPDGHF